MKKIITILVAAIAALILSTSCHPDKPLYDASLYGDWSLSSYSGSAAPEGLSIYFRFTSDNSFILCQRFNTLSYEVLRGTFTIKGTTLEGVYSDGTPWAAPYRYSLSGDTLTLTSLGEIEVESVYVRSKLPDSVLF